MYGPLSKRLLVLFCIQLDFNNNQSCLVNTVGCTFNCKQQIIDVEFILSSDLTNCLYRS